MNLYNRFVSIATGDDVHKTPCVWHRVTFGNRGGSFPQKATASLDSAYQSTEC